MFHWVQNEIDWKEVEATPDPNFYLADDYKESEVTDDYRFRMLISTRHL